MIKTWGKTSMVAFESERLTQSWKSLSKHDFPVDRFCSTEGFPNLGHPSDLIELILVFPHVFWHVSAGIQYFCNLVTGSPGRTRQMRWTFRSRFEAFRDYSNEPLGTTCRCMWSWVQISKNVVVSGSTELSTFLIFDPPPNKYLVSKHGNDGIIS